MKLEIWKILQGGALNLNQAWPALKQLNFSKLSDASGFKFSGCPTLQKFQNSSRMGVFP